MNDDLQSVYKLLHEVTETFRECASNSSERITRANEIVGNLTSLMDDVKNVYIHHIDQLSSNRDELVKQNTLLIRQNQKLMDKISKLEDMCAKSRDEYIDFLKIQATHQPQNSINLK